MKKFTSFFRKYSFLRIAGIITGFFPALFFLIFLIWDSVDALFGGKTGVIPLLILMIGSVTGYLLSYKIVRTGAVIMLTASIITGCYLLIAGGSDAWKMAVLFSFPFLIPAILFLFSGRSEMKRSEIGS